MSYLDVDYTKCANFPECENNHSWDANKFLNTPNDIDKIKLFLCEECWSRLNSGPQSFGIHLKNGYESVLRGTGKWTNKKETKD